MEFNCVECKRHIIRPVHHEGQPLLCAECLMVPGWFNDDLLRETLDPEMEKPKESEQ